jgi:hypothetical protein
MHDGSPSDSRFRPEADLRSTVVAQRDEIARLKGLDGRSSIKASDTASTCPTLSAAAPSRPDTTFRPGLRPTYEARA